MPTTSRIRNEFIESMIQKIEPRQDEYAPSSKTSLQTSLTSVQREQRQAECLINQVAEMKIGDTAIFNGYAKKGNDDSSDDELSDEDDSNQRLRRTILQKESELNVKRNFATKSKTHLESNESGESNNVDMKSVKHLISREYNFNF